MIAKLSAAEAAKVESIPITATLIGNFTNPKISTDISSAVTKLTTQLVNQQKDRLVKQGTSALNDFINKNKKPADTTAANTTATPTAKDEVKTKAAELLNGLFNKKKKVEEPKAN